MRVVAGIYKGRHFDIPRNFKARPTTDFAKENLFNVVRGYVDLEGALALDLFAGTGSISLELLSRGCQTVVSVEKERDHANFIQQCMNKIGTTGNVLIRGDVFRFLKGQKQAFDFIFADPPYQLVERTQLPTLIFERNLLRPNGVFVLEHGQQDDYSQHPFFFNHRAYGSVNFSFFRLSAEPSQAE